MSFHFPLSGPEFAYTSAEGYFGGFQVLAVMKKAAINTCVQGFVWT